jgi:hypothetical protein
MNRTLIGSLGLAVALVAMIGVGCDRGPRDDVRAARLPGTSSKSTLPRPDAHRIRFDAASRTLSLYDLADDQARWMLAGPRTSQGEPVSSGHVFTSDVDLDRVSVFYTIRGLASPALTLREVQSIQVAGGR